MNSSSPTFGRLVREARERRGWSQRTLATHIGVERSQVSKVETGERGPSYDLLVAAAVALDLDLNLLKEAEAPPEQAA